MITFLKECIDDGDDFRYCQRFRKTSHDSCVVAAINKRLQQQRLRNITVREKGFKKNRSFSVPFGT